MALNPNIALGVRGIEVANPLAQYAQISQLQSAQNQNALAQYQLATARREQESTNALNEAYRSAYNPQTGEIDVNTLRKTLSTGGFGSKLPGLEKMLGELQTQKLQTQKLQGEVTAQPIALQIQQANLADTKLKQSRAFLDTINPADPNAPAMYLKWHQANHSDPVIGPMLAARGVTADQSRAQIDAAIAQGPQAFAQLLNQSKLGTEKFMELNKPTTTAGPTGIVQIPGLGGPATVVPGTGGAFQMTPAQIESNKIARDRLAFEQGKFAFEKANPTMSIQEDPSGLLAVNTRTGVATPVVYGPMGFQAAPTAAPGASMMRQPPAALPGQRIPAIPGMTSVLDQVAASNAAMPLPAEGGVRVPGAPVSSKKEAPAKFNDTDMQLAGLAGSLKEFKDEVGKNLFTGAKFVPSGQDTARMTAKYTALLMGVKDLYTLGALTGPDMSIIESQLTNPASWSGKFTSKKGFDEQIKVIEDMLKRTTTNLESTYGRVPKASKRALEELPGGAAGGISGATANDPLGLGIR